MGEVVSLAEARAERARAAELSSRVVMHPALRWVRAGDPVWAHRRLRDGRTACGKTGPLTLADRTVARCPGCYRAAQR
ncbi:hypothetical protein [Microbispora sp. NPDC049125]|uniref:hypothetical protein n=1 Tax=Microbispora sp. NPDC049125 TaxID=3154929 RepID=UPI0034657B0F